MRLIFFALCALNAASALAESYVLPVATTRDHTTTVGVQNTASVDIACTFLFTPRDHATIYSNETIHGGGTRVYDGILGEIGALGTLRLDCSGSVVCAARIRTRDGGSGRVFGAANVERLATRAHALTITTASDVLLLEVAGRDVQVTTTVHGRGGTGIHTYRIPANAFQVVNLSAFRNEGKLAVDVHVISGDGALAAGLPSADASIAAITRPAPVALSANDNAARAAQLLTSAGFKAAPFEDPATGLVFMRDRWYDPQTATFLTPDREGYRDSPNLYVFAAGDPVNKSDPTGRVVALYGDARERQAAYQRILGTIDNAEAASHITIGPFNRLQINGMSEDQFIRRYSGRAKQLGEMIAADKIVFVTELVGNMEHPKPGAKWPYPLTLEEQVHRAGGGFFDPTFFGSYSHKALAAFDPRLFPRKLADVIETANTVFVHEFFGHAYAWAVPHGLTESYTGKIREQYVKKCDLCYGVSAGEADGMAAEDQYRLDHNLPLRTYYDAAPDDYIPPAWLAPYIQRQKAKH